MSLAIIDALFSFQARVVRAQTTTQSALGLIEHASSLSGCTVPPETPTPGILCYTDDFHVYISPAGCTGTSCFQPAVGTPGAAGATGATGPQGPAGPTGPAGSNGVTQVTVCNLAGSACGAAQTGAVQLDIPKALQ